MSRNNNDLGVALVKLACPVCGKTSKENIIMNKFLTPHDADNVNAMNGKCIGFSGNACSECASHKDEMTYLVEVDESRSDFKRMETIYRTGRIAFVKKSSKFLKDAKDFILKTQDGVEYMFADREVFKNLGLDK